MDRNWLQRLASLHSQGFETLRRCSIAQTHRLRFGVLEADLWTYTRVEKRVWFQRLQSKTIPPLERCVFKIQASNGRMSDFGNFGSFGTFGIGRIDTRGLCVSSGSLAEAACLQASIVGSFARKLRVERRSVWYREVDRVQMAFRSTFAIASSLSSPIRSSRSFFVINPLSYSFLTRITFAMNGPRTAL